LPGLSLEIKTQISENETRVFERKWKERERGHTQNAGIRTYGNVINTK
jgi:hypothetical protein